MKKLNVCLVTLTVSPDSQDGSAKFIRGIFEYLKRQPHINVKLITAEWNLNLKEPHIVQKKVVKKSYFWIPQFTLEIIKYLKNNTFDIIHGNGPKGSLPLLLLGKNYKFISTLHDLGPFETQFSLIPVEKYLFKRVAKKASFITTCSNSIKNSIKKKIPEVNINTIFNLYSAIEDKYKPYPTEAHKLKLDLGIEGPILLYIGRIALYKGVADIITAYKIAKKSIPNLNLVLGGKPDFYMEKYYEIWKQRYKDIYFLGFVPDDQIPTYYSMGDIFINYSYAAEGFGLTPIEAIACGTPVICSTLPAFKEVLQDHAIFVPPRKPSLLAKEIIKLINNKEKRLKMVQNAQQFIKRYTWDSVGKKLEQIYKLALSH